MRPGPSWPSMSWTTTPTAWLHMPTLVCSSMMPVGSLGSPSGPPQLAGRNPDWPGTRTGSRCQVDLTVGGLQQIRGAEPPRPYSSWTVAALTRSLDCACRAILDPAGWVAGQRRGGHDLRAGDSGSPLMCWLRAPLGETTIKTHDSGPALAGPELAAECKPETRALLPAQPQWSRRTATILHANALARLEVRSGQVTVPTKPSVLASPHDRTAPTLGAGDGAASCM